jgi:RNA polymerase sigma-70 factor (sigma-E family)
MFGRRAAGPTWSDRRPRRPPPDADTERQATLDDIEEEHFRQFAAGRLAALRRTGYLICGDWHLAEDAVSTVMTKLYVSWSSARRADNIDAYVRRMLIRAIVDERRRPWRRESPAQYPLTTTREVPPNTVDDRIVLRAALAQMPPRRRAVLVLRYFEGLNVEETAAAMGCSAGTVKSQTARALAALRALMPADDMLQEGATG